VYTGVDILITAIFATLVKFILFGVFIKVTYFVRSGVVIDGFIISSLVVGCYLTLKQSEIKRFIACSSIVHVGFLLMGDFTSSIIYITTYALSNLVLFSVIVNTRLIGKEILYLNDLKNLRQLGLHNVFLMVAALASAAGLPPFAGFYGKFLT
jgi:NADH-quinone oxidoreductase subunit N